MTGRPTKLTAQRADGIIAMLEHGHTRTDAAEANGIVRSTLQDWIARGEHDHQHNHPDPADYTLPQLRAIAAEQDIDLTAEITGRVTKAKIAEIVTLPTPYSDFSDRVKRAEPIARRYVWQEADRTGAEDWRYWVTKAERLWPHLYARRYQQPATPAAETGGMTAERVAEDADLVLKVLEGGANG